MISLENVPEQNPHYVQSVSELGEEQEVIARDDIYAANGMKLVAKGARINRSQCDRLNLHKLRTPLDQMLKAERSVDAAMLVGDANRIFASDASMARLAERSGDPNGFRHGLGVLELPAPLAFRMTVMRETRSDMYRHMMQVCIIAHSIAVRLKLSDRDKGDLMMAALCHDVGEMHTDPMMLAHGHRIASEERRFIHVHPVTGFVILQDMPGLPASVMQAVLHHHERLDGSGYPYGLKEAAIHPLARILCVAEVMEGVVRRADLQRLDVLLRLNQHRFDQAVVSTLRDLLRTDTRDAEPSPVSSSASARLTQVTTVLKTWPGIQSALKAQPLSPTLGFLDERMRMLRSLVLQAGIDPENTDGLFAWVSEEASLLSELNNTLEELQWLMLDIANELERRTEQLEGLAEVIVGEMVILLRQDCASAVDSSPIES